MIKDCKTIENFNTILENSKTNPVFLLKHSTACPHSAFALERFEEFSKKEKGGECWKVLVIEDRPVSLHIANMSGIMHQSPQAILFYNGKALWTGYRNEINFENMDREYKKIS